MKGVLKDVIVDQRNILKQRSVVDRFFPQSFIDSEEIVVISGVRRCGKSVLLQQIRKRMPQGDFFLNFDDDRLSGFRQENFQDLYEVFVELYGDEEFFYFDEIQNVSGWEHFVKRLYNMGKKVFVSGSNARMLSRELGTLLTGCYLSYELFPFSFTEFLRWSGEHQLLADVLGTVKKGKVLSMFDSYMKEGGFPMYLKSKDPLFLKTLYDNILYRDVMVRNSLTNEKELKELVFFLTSNIGKPVSYTSLAKVIGVSNPSTVKSYMDFVENTYLLQSVSRYDESVKVQLRNPKKVYCIDNAMVMRLGFHFSEERGRLLENLVYIELRRRGMEVFYYNDGKTECDFVVREGAIVTQVIQVCLSLTNVEVRDREQKGLLSAMDRMGLENGLLLTESTEEEIVVGDKVIHVLPVWKWMVENKCRI